MKRKTKGMLAAAAALMCIFVASGCGKSGGGSDAANPASSGSGETAAQNSKSDSGAEEIVEYYLGGPRTDLLTNKGNVYYLGEKGSLKSDDKKVTTPTKYLENIKSLITISTYIDNNLDLYLGGIDVVKGGILKEPKKLGSNIVQVEGSNIGFLALDKDGNLYSFGKKGYSGSNNDEVYAELTKVDGIKDVVKIGSNGVSNDGYLALTKDGTVYAKRFDGPFTKLMENVKDIQGVYITDKDDVVYVWDEFTKDKVTKIAKSLQISWGGSSDSVWFIENNTIAPYNSKGEPIRMDEDVKHLFSYYPKDIKKIFIYEDKTDKKDNKTKNLKMVYENTNGEIVLYAVSNSHSDKGKVEVNTKVTKSLDDAVKVWEFVKDSK